MRARGAEQQRAGVARRDERLGATLGDRADRARERGVGALRGGGGMLVHRDRVGRVQDLDARGVRRPARRAPVRGCAASPASSTRMSVLRESDAAARSGGVGGEVAAHRVERDAAGARSCRVHARRLSRSARSARRGARRAAPAEALAQIRLGERPEGGRRGRRHRARGATREVARRHGRARAPVRARRRAGAAPRRSATGSGPRRAARRRQRTRPSDQRRRRAPPRSRRSRPLQPRELAPAAAAARGVPSPSAAARSRASACHADPAGAQRAQLIRAVELDDVLVPPVLGRAGDVAQLREHAESARRAGAGRAASDRSAPSRARSKCTSTQACASARDSSTKPPNSLLRPPAKPFTSRAGMPWVRSNITIADAKYSQCPSVSSSTKRSTGERGSSGRSGGGVSL